MDVDERLRRAGQEWRNTVSAPFESAQLAREWTVGADGRLDEEEVDRRAVQ